MKLNGEKGGRAGMAGQSGVLFLVGNVVVAGASLILLLHLKMQRAG